MNNLTLAILNQLPAFDASIEERARGVFDAARDLVVNDATVRQLADTDLAACKKLLRDLEAARKLAKEPTLEAGREIDRQYEAPKGFLDQAIALLTQAILTFDRAEAAKRAAAQLAADKAAEAQRKALEKQGARLKKAGDTESAAAVKEAAALVVAPVIPLAVPKSEQSTNHVVTWSAEVVDLMALVKAVAEGRASLKCLSYDLTYLNGQARLEKADLKIDGVRAVPTESLRAKRSAA
jgi:hypothetical protein